MKNPQTQIANLRDRIADRVVDLDSKLRDTQEFYEFIKEAKYLKVVNKSPQFFRIHNISIQRDLIISLAKTFDPGSKRSIHKLIQWTNQNLNNIDFKGQPLEKNDIKMFRSQIDELNEIVCNIKTQRDQSIAHDEPKYFDRVFRISEQAPIELTDLSKVLKVLRKILRKLYWSMDNKDRDIKLAYRKNVTFVLKLLLHQEILSENEKVREKINNGDLPSLIDL